MCNQAVSLAAAEIERNGIATVSLILLRMIAERVRPSRALTLPFPHGFPLGRPNESSPPLWLSFHGAISLRHRSSTFSLPKRATRLPATILVLGESARMVENDP